MNKATIGKNIFLLLKVTTLTTTLSLLTLTPAHAIKKCKDAEGRWHYGDIAVRECQNSKVTTLSDGGFIKGQKEAPKTEEELLQLKAQEKELEAQRLVLEEQKKKELFEESEKVRILSIYETEADIDRQRDNQLYSVESNIAVHNTFLESMDERIAHEEKQLIKEKSTSKKTKIEKRISAAKKNIEIYSAEVKLLEQQRIAIVDRFEREKKLYLELTEEKSEK